jgi:hypothetical protein
MNFGKINDIHLIKVYAYHGDGGDRGTGPILGYCSTKYQADLESTHTGFYGGKGWVSETSAIRINNEVYILAGEHPVDLDGVKAKSDAELKEKTLASLTDEQKRVLGLK